MQTTPTTRTSSTLSHYDRIAQRLARHAERLRASGNLGLVADRGLQLVFAFQDLEPTISKDSARQYRAALLNHMTRWPSPLDAQARRLLTPSTDPVANQRRQERLHAARTANLTARRGAQQKAKWVATQDWARLLLALAQTDSRWAMPAIFWTTSTLSTGLRPSEWARADLVGMQLVVPNGKATNGRAHSASRTIELGALSVAQIESVRMLLYVVSQHPDRFLDLYNGVRDVVRRVAREVFAGRQTFPSLYSARHCFAARAKATHGKVDVAALMGHASIQTAARHYAQAWRARGGRPLEVTPSSEDVQAVLRRNPPRVDIDLG